MGHFACGHGDGELQGFHGQLEARQQRQGQQQPVLHVLALFQHFQHGILIDLHGLGDGEFKAHGGFPQVALGDAADVDQGCGSGFGGGHFGTVEGDILGGFRQGKVEAAIIGFQTQHDLHGDQGIALGVDRHIQVHGRGGTLGRSRQNQNTHQQNANKYKGKQSLQRKTSLLLGLYLSILSCVRGKSNGFLTKQGKVPEERTSGFRNSPPSGA